jgi:prevent-host-death family protein
MTTVSVDSLKTELSRYLRTVRGGEEVVVSSHNHPVAKLVPYEEASGAGIRRPQQPMSRLKSVEGVEPLKAVDAVRLLVEDRCRR